MFLKNVNKERKCVFKNVKDAGFEKMAGGFKNEPPSLRGSGVVFPQVAPSLGGFARCDFKAHFWGIPINFLTWGRTWGVVLLTWSNLGGRYL